MISISQMFTKLTYPDMVKFGWRNVFSSVPDALVEVGISTLLI